jgi:hypothetical protein
MEVQFLFQSFIVLRKSLNERTRRLLKEKNERQDVFTRRQKIKYNDYV